MLWVLRIFAGGCALLFMQVSALAEARLTIFAAASLKGALDEVLLQSGQDVVVSYGGSGLIARQVALGAPADLVILANQAWMDWLALKEGQNLLMQKPLLGNALVVIAPVGMSGASQVLPHDIPEQLGSGRLAIGMVNSVPAGIYGRQWLEQAGLWSALQARLAETDNVRAALTLVARGEAPLGIVYASDAQADTGVQVVYEIPGGAHDPITYPLAVMDSKNTVQANDLAEFLSSDRSTKIFTEHGFLPPGATQ